MKEERTLHVLYLINIVILLIKCYMIVGCPKDFKFTKGKSVEYNVVSSQSTDGTSYETIESPKFNQ